MYRQGDLLIVPVEKIPDDARKADDTVLAFGEQTGHTHRLVGGEVMLTKDQVYFTVAIPTPLEHDEHATLVIPPGDWKVVQQREYYGERERPAYD